MSRAFTKEDDAGEDLPERPVPAGPNYMTPRGLEMLKAQGRELVIRREKAKVEGGDLRPFDRDLRYLEARIDSALVVPPGAGPEIRFGARVTIEEENGQQKTLQIVGEDEARTEPTFLSWSSPLALAMMGTRAGDHVTWEGPEHTRRFKILSVDYPPL